MSMDLMVGMMVGQAEDCLEVIQEEVHLVVVEEMAEGMEVVMGVETHLYNMGHICRHLLKFSIFRMCSLTSGNLYN